MRGFRCACAVAVLCVGLVFSAGCVPQRRATVAPTLPPLAPPAPPVTPILPPPPPPRLPSTPADSSFNSLPRPQNVTGNLDAALGRHWKYIVIHHSASDSGNEAVFDREHKDRGWRGVGYDFVIDNGEGGPDGRVEVTFRWEQQIEGAHAGNDEYNQYGIGICLVGNFDRDLPTAKQMDSLVALVNYLQKRCDIPTDHILGHCHVRIGGTHCPGLRFPWYDLFARLGH
jgi:N-acetylmuramoyl-L-alanine amidase